MAFSLTEKLTVIEAKEWLNNTLASLTDADDTTFIQAMHDFKAALPRKPRAAKKTSTSSERSEEEYKEDHCDARVWLKGGFGAQCSCKKVDGQFLCKRHQNEADKNDNQVKNGLVTGDRPTHHYNDTDNAQIPWHDVTIEKTTKAGKKTSASGDRKQRKCGCCGELGHDKRKCPKNNGESSSPTMSVAELEAALAAAKAAESAPAESSPAESAPAANSAEELDEDTTDLTAEEQVAAGTGLLEQADEDEIGEELDNENDSAGDDENDTDNTSTRCDFEGVEYTRDSNNGVVDDEFDEVGTWVDGSIEFTAAGAKQHRMAKAAA